MLVLMCGLPSCGKSKSVDIISDNYSDPLLVIRPEDWLPENISDLTEGEEKNYRIECWRTAMAETEKMIEEKKNSVIIILDCGNSKFRTLGGIIRMAKRNNHKIVVLYVNSRLSECEKRAGEQWVGTDIAKAYVENIRDSLPKSATERIQHFALKDEGIKGANKLF